MKTGDASLLSSAQPERFRRLLTHAGLIAFGILLLYPLIWMFAGSFKPAERIFTDPGLWSSVWTGSNYTEGWDALRVPFGRFFMNSIVVSVAAVIGNLVACSMAAYAFARLDFRFRRFWFALMLGSIMLPFHVVVVPQYIMFSELGWVNTYWPLIVPKLLGTDAFFIFLMVQFIRSLPIDLDEAAWVDGAGPFTIYWRIILPLTLPALATTAIFTFIWTWNDFFTPLIYLTQQELYTVPVALASFLDATGRSAWGALFAMSFLSLGPILGFFIAGQRYLVQGFATTGLK